MFPNDWLKLGRFLDFVSFRAWYSPLYSSMLLTFLLPYLQRNDIRLDVPIFDIQVVFQDIKLPFGVILAFFIAVFHTTAVSIYGACCPPEIRDKRSKLEILKDLNPEDIAHAVQTQLTLITDKERLRFEPMEKQLQEILGDRFGEENVKDCISEIRDKITESEREKALQAFDVDELLSSGDVWVKQLCYVLATLSLICFVVCIAILFGNIIRLV